MDNLTPRLRRLRDRAGGEESSNLSDANDGQGYLSDDDLSLQLERLQIKPTDQARALQQAQNHHREIVNRAQQAMKENGDVTYQMYQAAQILVDKGYFPHTKEEIATGGPNKNLEQVQQRSRRYSTRALLADQRRQALLQAVKYLESKIEVYQKGGFLDYAIQLLNLQAGLASLAILNVTGDLPHDMFDNKALYFSQSNRAQNLRLQALEALGIRTKNICDIFEQLNVPLTGLQPRRGHASTSSTNSHGV